MQPNAVGAIGHIDVYPNSRNIIPGKVVFTIDLRTHILDKLNGMVDELMARAPKLCEDIGVSFEPPKSSASSTRRPLTHGCVAAIRDAADRLGYSHMDIVSGRATTPAGSTMWRPRRWSCAPVSTGSAITKPKRSPRNGPKRAPMC
jgi:acetylornithine deacetylase/succinyl-diaminopimelate desuccinylase-like protein